MFVSYGQKAHEESYGKWRAFFKAQHRKELKEVIKMAGSIVAYGVYKYGATVNSGQVGRANYDGTTTITHDVANIIGLSPDPKVFWFENINGEGRLIVEETQYDANFNPLPAKFSVYTADPDTIAPPTFEKVWPSGGDKKELGGLVNVYAIETIVLQEDSVDVNYLYGIDYDLHKVFRIKNPSGDEYSYDAEHVYDDAVAQNQKYGVALSIAGSFVYALFIRGANVFGGVYTTSVIVKWPLDLDPEATGSGALTNDTLAANAVDLKPYGNYLYIPSIGGKQQEDNYNAGSKLQRVALSDLTVEDLLINAESGGTPGDEDTVDFRDISIAAEGSDKDGELFILKGNMDAELLGFYGFLFRTTVSDVESAAAQAPVTISSLSLPNLAIGSRGTGNSVLGYLWALLYDDADGKTWMAEGSALSVYSYTSRPSEITQVTTIDIAALAPAGYTLNPTAITIYGQGQLRGAQHPNQVSNSQQANSARASAAAAESGEDEG
jgi:hypothetical protein